VDWANVGSPTTTVNLSGTTVGTATTLTNAPSDSSGTTTLLSRLTATRAGYLDNISTAAPTAATNAAAVWDEARSGHVTSGTFGAGVIVQTNNDKTGYTASTVSDKTGYSLTQTFPSNFSSLAISGAGNVTVGGYLSGQDPATLLLAATVDSTLTVKQVFAIAQSILAGKYSTTLVGSTRTTTYKRADGTTTLAVSSVSIADPQVRTWTFSNLP
jgi:hypothetical protein